MGILSDAGLPHGLVTLITRAGCGVDRPLGENEAVDGVVFTGSRVVGRSIRATVFEQRKCGPDIGELEGKNKVIVSDEADLEKAVSGVANGAFRFAGRKSSRTSRVYVHEGVIESFTHELLEARKALGIRTPKREATFVSPLIDDSALERYRIVCETVRAEGRIHTGDDVLRSADVPDGRYVQPTVVTGTPTTTT